MGRTDISRQIRRAFLDRRRSPGRLCLVLYFVMVLAFLGVAKSAVPINFRQRLRRFDASSIPIRKNEKSMPINHAENLCNWIKQAPADEVCPPIARLANTIHQFDEKAAEEKLSTDIAEDLVDKSPCLLDTNYPSDWSVESLGLPQNSGEQVSSSLSGHEQQRAELKEALFWTLASKRGSITAATLDQLKMSGRWKPIATLRFRGRAADCSNMGVVFAASSSERPTETDVLVALRSTMAPSDGTINMDMDQEVVEYGGKLLALHRGYSTAAKVLLEQLRAPLLSLVQDNKLSTLTVTGFSMGGGIAAALGVHVVGALTSETSLPVKERLLVTTFGAPRFGNHAAGQYLDQHSQVETVAAKHDFIAGLPCMRSPVCFEDDFFRSGRPSVSQVPRKWVDYSDAPGMVVIDPSHLDNRTAMEYHTLAYSIVTKDSWYVRDVVVENNSDFSGKSRAALGDTSSDRNVPEALEPPSS